MRGEEREVERRLDRRVLQEPECPICALRACDEHSEYPGVPMKDMREWYDLQRLRGRLRRGE